jgi:beta-1,2-mannobiose phosphorylase / 1,2-beta-oligomannan phosphorylase
MKETDIKLQRYADNPIPAEDIIDKYPPEQRPGISICFSSNLREWVDDRPLAGPVFPWENYKIGGSSQPIRTDRGWLALYLADPTRVIARAPEPILEPEEPWEREGTVPMVVFPNSAVVIDGARFAYYGGADTVTAVAKANLCELTDLVMRYPTAGKRQPATPTDQKDAQ